LQQGPWEDFCFRNVVPGRGAAAVPVKFRRGLAGVRPGRVGERSTGHWGPVCGSLGASGGRWEGARRRSGALAAAAGSAGEGGGPPAVARCRRAVVELKEGAAVLWVRWNRTEEGLLRRCCQAAVADGIVHRRPQPVGARPLRASAAGAGGWAGFLGVCTRPWQARLAGGADDGPRGRGDGGTTT
jgi:hypothetical protein